MSRYVDLNDEVYLRDDGEYENYNIRPDAPSIDIVRCRECKWWNCEMSGCKRNPSVVAWRDDDFCSYGERSSEC